MRNDLIRIFMKSMEDKGCKIPRDIFQSFRYFTEESSILWREGGRNEMVTNEQAYENISEFCRRISFEYSGLIYLLFAIKRRRYLIPEQVR